MRGTYLANSNIELRIEWAKVSALRKEVKTLNSRAHISISSDAGSVEGWL